MSELRDKLGYNFRYAGVKYYHVTEGDAADLHEYFRNIFSSYGLSGQALDEAIAGCVRPAFAAIDKHLAAGEKIKLVSSR